MKRRVSIGGNALQESGRTSSRKRKQLTVDIGSMRQQLQNDPATETSSRKGHRMKGSIF
jgi:hypothetical protein